MDIIAVILFFIFAAVYFGLCFWVRRNDNGFKETMTERTTGQLVGETVERKAATHLFGEKTHKKTVATYRYTVGEKTFHRECVLFDRFRPVPASTKVVYQRRRPYVSYLPELEAADTKGMGTYYFFFALFFLLTALLYIIFAM